MMEQFQASMVQFRARFAAAAAQYDASFRHARELQTAIDDYSSFVTNPELQRGWERLAPDNLATLQPLVLQLRDVSARCVAIMEKYRALKLIRGGDDKHEYFQHIEASIEKEFGRFAVTAGSKLLLVGSGAFPMTPLLIAKRTGAAVTGIDIDGEAVELGRGIVGRLGPDLPIRLEHLPLESLEGLDEMTHIIISSTVPVKYGMLHWLHGRTRPDVVVAIRYGNGLKSLFNYPMEVTDRTKWRLAETDERPRHVFDVALYRKAATHAYAEGGSI